MMNITMLVANRPRLTKQALDSIGDLSDATMTILDAGMNDEVSHIARGFGGVESSYIRAQGEPCGTGPARNAVILAAEYFFGRGDYLYLSDDDVWFERSDWIDILVSSYEQMREHGYRVLAAYNHPFNGPISGEPWLRTYTPGYDVRPVYAVATQSMLMSWDVWDEFGPFCDTPAGKVCQSEDVDFCNRIRAAGYKVGVISPALLVNCGITNSFGEKIVGWEMVKAEAPEGVICE